MEQSGFTHHLAKVFNDFFAFSNKINQMKHKYYFVILKIVI
jgi:hypothetical protein